jgi:hypothetical protein
MRAVSEVLGRICEEQVVVYLNVLSQYFTRGSKENHIDLSYESQL